MKKNYWKLMAAVLTIVLSAGFASCGDDDDDSATPSQQGIPTTDGETVRLIGFGGLQFEYDANGRLTSFGDGYDKYEISSSFVISYQDSYQDGDENYEYKVSTNGSGFISKIVINYNANEDDGSWYKGSATMNFSYNGRQLTGFSGSGESEDYDAVGGEKRNETSNVTQKNTWQNNNLTKCEYQMKNTWTTNFYEGTGSFTEVETTVFSYGQQANATKQFPYSLGNKASVGGISALCLVGLFGDGPAYLPTGFTSEWSEDYGLGEPDTHSRSYKLEFTQNANGTIATEKENDNEYKYVYSNATRAVMQQVESQLPALKTILFKRHRK